MGSTSLEIRRRPKPPAILTLGSAERFAIRENRRLVRIFAADFGWRGAGKYLKLSRIALR
jgi:hypothetical protein